VENRAKTPTGRSGRRTDCTLEDDSIKPEKKLGRGLEGEIAINDRGSERYRRWDLGGKKAWRGKATP